MHKYSNKYKNRLDKKWSIFFPQHVQLCNLFHKLSIMHEGQPQFNHLWLMLFVIQSGVQVTASCPSDKTWHIMKDLILAFSNLQKYPVGVILNTYSIQNASSHVQVKFTQSLEIKFQIHRTKIYRPKHFKSTTHLNRCVIFPEAFPQVKYLIFVDKY